jgi:branched-chain amino acid transport system substrate-binding protein
MATLMAVVAATLALGACQKKEGGDAAGSVIRIGHVAPLSGGDAHLGKDNEDGARLAAEEINAAGGVKLGDKTYTVQILGEDDKADPREATLAANKLVDAGAVAVVGHLNSGSSIPASKVYADAGMAQISPSSTNPKYTDQGFRTAFRVVANDNQQGAVLADFAIDSLKVHTVAVIDDRTAYGQGLADVVDRVLRQRGVTVVAREYTDSKASDFSAILTKIRAAHPDAIFYGGMDDTAGPLAKQVHQLGIRVPLVGGDGACTLEFIKLAGEGADAMTCSRAGEAVERLPRGADFMSRFQKRFGAPVQIYAPYSYDAVQIIVEAIRRSGSLERAAVAAAVARTDLEGLTGHLRFDDKGDVRNGAITLYKVKDGQLAFVSTVR